MKKTNYFYIDESGHVNNDSPLFLYGCIKTDTPNELENTLIKTKGDMSEEVYFQHIRDELMERNFHAVDDHFDVRAAIYKILPYLNFRGYFIVTNKKSEYFKNLKKNNEDFEIIEYLLKKIIVPRVTKNKDDKNIFYFETLEVEKKSLNNIIDDIFRPLKEKYDVEYHIVGKDNITMGIVDYINYNLYYVLNPNKKINSDDRNYINFEILKDKIGLINILDNDTFFSRFGEEDFTIEFQNLRKNIAGF